MEAITDFREIISHCTGNTNETTSVIYLRLYRYTEVIVTDKKRWKAHDKNASKNIHQIGLTQQGQK
jgi:hypothetical protein